ncbi:DEAD/DEAH box helicase [Acinetobacter towneri]|uniref:DEAD/DEAH box helicase n=1 Tax=Acinetobacter towneri TaxID=202956 RepID=A0AAP9GVK7_9GAMM|nr:DEAD/DEAH box helicase [Acinetobacter towneri]QGM27849.1 DEAD/DEAH box helicase [Acinetobacter towneri]
MPKLKEFYLKQGQYLADSDVFVQKNALTMLQAGTGVGKTTVVTDKFLKDFDCVVMVVPSVLKVTELEEAYKKKLSGTRFLFFYDKHSPSETTFMKDRKHMVVCTYEKLEKVKEFLPKGYQDKTLLVVDECHKLYSAGYRHVALNSLLYSILKKKFPTIVFLTATFTEHCWKTLEIPLDHTYTVYSENSLSRNVEVVLLKKGDQYSFVHLVMDRINAMKKEGKRGKILIRLNNRKKCEMIAKLFESMFKLKVLVVHSKNKHEDAVKEMFHRQEIPKDIDVVLSTSIMDEAINLNNLQEEIDSVFVLGKDAHPEELVQFLGRLRNATVPCFIVLHTNMAVDTTVAPEKLHDIYLKKNMQFLEKINTVSDLLISVYDDYQLVGDDDEECEKHSYASLYRKVNTLNETFEYFSGSKIFAVINGAVKKNIASISSAYYRMDKACSYQNFSYFKYRIQALLPTCNVTLREEHSLKTDKSILSFLGAAKKTNEQQKQDSIDTAMEIFLSVEPEIEDCKTEQEVMESRNIKMSNWIDEDTIYEDDDEPEQPFTESHTLQDLPDRETESKILLKNYGVFILREQQEDEFYVPRLVANYVVPYPEVTAELVSTIAILSTYISNLEDIYQILKRNESEKVIMLAKAYADNIVVRYFVNRFYRYSPDRYFGAYQLRPDEAVTWMTDAFTAIQKKQRIPMKTFLDQKLVSGMKLDMRTKQMVIDPSKAANFFVRFFAVKDRNAKKPDLRYLEFHGIVFGNYQYLTTAKKQAKYKNVSPQFQIGQRVFDSMTGECVSDTPSPLVRSRLIIEEEEFFDDVA